MKFDFLIVGAGLSGIVLAERLANKSNKTCLIIEKRNHIAGNAYDFYNEDGILVHKYGPHIFHTNMQKVADYLSQFTQWIPYEHKVLANVNDSNIPVPFNLNSLFQSFSSEKAKKLEAKLLSNYEYGLKIPILKMLENKDEDIKELAQFIYDKIFLNYNLKQWDLRPEELDFSVSSRVPVFISHDNRYFQDSFQFMPKNGYTAMCEKMIDHKNISIKLNTDFNKIDNEIEFDKLIYTGPIDSYFDYKFGKLPYRSLKFEFQTKDTNQFQEVGQINYPNTNKFTRITEFKHLTKQVHSKTTIAYEFSELYNSELNEPYYPIPQERNNELYLRYKNEAEKLSGKVYFVGRLADYKYYNMDQTIGVALQLFDKNFAE